ncbi:hypothetical protein GCM10010430_80770 [Kitasatospora cystarginea]|uniref:Plasmid stabilization protein n=1 Tax=Kitasatospora cystarginea TaxID=58350 RepID=A0ABN3F2X1_9ACTN
MRGRRHGAHPRNEEEPHACGSSKKRERQYEHIKDSARDRTESEIAARTVNKERARHGESKTASWLRRSEARGA